MTESELIGEMSTGTALPVIRVHKVAILQVQFVLFHECGPLLRKEEHLAVVDLDGRFRLIFGRRQSLRTGRGGARVRWIENVSREAALLAAVVLLDRFRARQPAARDSYSHSSMSTAVAAGLRLVVTFEMGGVDMSRRCHTRYCFYLRMVGKFPRTSQAPEVRF